MNQQLILIILQNQESGEVPNAQLKKPSTRYYLNELNTLASTKDIFMVGYDLNDEEIFFNSKEVILRNLVNNLKLIKMPRFPLADLLKFYKFMKETNYSSDSLAESLILLYSSKCNGNLHDFKTLFKNFDCHIVKREDFEFYDELKFLFERIVKMDYFRSVMIESVKNIYGKCEFNFLDLELVMFVDIKRSMRFKLCPEYQKAVVFDLEFIRLIFHETVYVVLRSNMQNLNSSIPFLEKEKIQQPLVSEEDLIELGMKTEIKVFHGLLNLIDSLEAGELNFSFCKQFLNNFLDNQPVNFSIEESNCLTFKQEDFLKMALDYRPHKFKRFLH
ncbi:unnamed protein product [Brachionus calyciflorus]|uniref:Uncharacterized protein n=1 Tax=Brachionus calyciflorus TaxID=104777 RepID=A0A813U2N2_9BILA|nr:unnamed protein product [Brachionus calyciflorus]